MLAVSSWSFALLSGSMVVGTEITFCGKGGSVSMSIILGGETNLCMGYYIMNKIGSGRMFPGYISWYVINGGSSIVSV